MIILKLIICILFIILFITSFCNINSIDGFTVCNENDELCNKTNDILINKLSEHNIYTQKFNNKINKDKNKFKNINKPYNIKYDDIIVKKFPMNVNDEFICPTIKNVPFNCMKADNIYNSKIAGPSHLSDSSIHRFRYNYIPTKQRKWFGTGISEDYKSNLINKDRLIKSLNEYNLSDDEREELIHSFGEKLK